MTSPGGGRGRHAADARTGSVARTLLVGVPAAALIALIAAAIALSPRDPEATAPSPTVATPAASATPSPTPPPSPVAINAAFPGLTTFRGNATRSFYGTGPIPRTAPTVLWRYPATGALCMVSGTPDDPQKRWCGTGWTGQPNVIVAEDGSIEIRIGAYDGAYHFLDGRTGLPVRPSLQTGDLAKGSATSDPDGYPLYYAGSRDDLFRIVALDRPEPTVLWSVDSRSSVPEPRWNTDWDGAALVVDGHLLVGGENSWFYVIRLNRGYDAQGLVTVAPEIVASVPSWDDELRAAVPDGDYAIENSVAYRDGIAYFSNGAGLVQGWDVSQVLGGGTDIRRVFRFWTGDDTDASPVIDEEGFLYVASELQRFNARAEEIGQLIKLDPGRPSDPLVWSVPVTERARVDGLGGLWATPALHDDLVIVGTNGGDLLAVDRATGRERWRMDLVEPVWSSAVPVDGVLLQGDCRGYLRAYDLTAASDGPPPELWSIYLGGCVESTPAVWGGTIWVGTRGGQIFAIG